MKRNAQHDSFHPAYFTVKFATEITTFPEAFAIITAYATTGEAWTDTENTTADTALYEKLLAMGYTPERITGFSEERFRNALI